MTALTATPAAVGENGEIAGAWLQPATGRGPGMDISSIGATAVLTQAAQREQVLSMNAVKQQNAAEQAIVAMLDQAAPSAAPSGDSNRGGRLNIVV